MIQDLTSPIGELSGKSVKTKNEASKIKTVQQLAKFAVDHKHCIRKDGLPPGVDIHTVSRVADYITEAKHDGNVIAHGGRPIDRSRGEYSVKIKPVLYIWLHKTIFHSHISSHI
jgi:hypothetical protein